MPKDEHGRDQRDQVDEHRGGLHEVEVRPQHPDDERWTGEHRRECVDDHRDHRADAIEHARRRARAGTTLHLHQAARDPKGKGTGLQGAW
jgi:hypothetical protein